MSKVLKLAGGIPVFDSHFHIVDRRFPLVPNQGYLPDDFACGDYLARTDGMALCGGAIVSGSFQAMDQSYLLDALATLGPAFVGVTQLPATVSEAELLRLDAAGVRAVRFNIKRGGSEGIEHLEEMAHRVHQMLRWHVELYIDSRELAGLERTLLTLPAVSIDHLGLSKDGFKVLLKLVEHGVRVKATGFGRVDFDVKGALKEIASANPEALMFGTDLPSTRAPRPYRDEDLLLVLDALGEDLARKALYQNALAFYRPAVDGSAALTSH
ncbi:amidohydrolase 2 [Citrifermentans bremense]|uniref:Amidohydrolase 2 n=1 Tax=Citrifermentans bremense TaxID=60035 RepID=A0A6S6M2U3_9BACT|nr:amidohydrolase family protein [Citrifermentans bremense]BCG45954.1 amidohydrolase 2 [Citrifermentans bremense]